MSFCLILTVVSMNPEQLPMRSGWEGGLGETVSGFASSFFSSSSSSPSLVAADPVHPPLGGCNREFCLDIHCLLSQNSEHVGQLKRSQLNLKLCKYFRFFFSFNNSHILAKRMQINKLKKSVVPHLFWATAVIKQLNSAQLENLVQKGRRLVYVNRNAALAGWIPHSFIKVFQPGGRAIKYTLDVNQIGGHMQYTQFHTGNHEDVKN